MTLRSPSWPQGLSGNRSLEQARATRTQGHAVPGSPKIISSKAEFKPEHYRFQRTQSWALRICEWEDRLPPPIKGLEKQIGGFLFGLIVGGYVIFLIAAGYW